MPNAADTQAVIEENLKDAGFDANKTRRCMEMLSSGSYDELYRFLAEHRKELLNSVHECTKQLDCLDYLVYKLRKTEVY